MKKLFIILLSLFGTVTFGQKVNRDYEEEPKDAVARVHKTLDSASKIYKKKIVMFDHTIIGDNESVYFKFYRNGKIIDTTIIVGNSPLKTKKKVVTKLKDMK